MAESKSSMIGEIITRRYGVPTRDTGGESDAV